MSEWVISHFPAHECYVEPFGGSAQVLIDKPESFQEVYNDKDGDIVQFFDVLRDQSDELVEWLELTPFSRGLHSRWANEYYDGERRDDPIERAGIFFYLRETQFTGKYKGISGFSTRKDRNRGKRYAKSVQQLKEFAERFKSVTVENLDCERVIERYDGEDTFFYCDPPYIEEGKALYPESVDHSDFIETLQKVEGEWAVSYTDVPDGLADERVVRKDYAQNMNTSGGYEDNESRRESLVMSYPESEQGTFSEVSSAAGGDW